MTPANLNNSSTAYQWYVIFVLLLAQMFSFLDRMIMGLLVGPIRESFAISDTQYSLLAGLAFSLFYAIMGLPLARIADSRNRRNLISIGIAVWSVMTAVCGLAKGFVSLFFARIGVGIGEATLGPAGYSMITDYFPRSSLARALSVYTLGVTFGSGLAYILGGAVVGYVQTLDTLTLPFLGATEGWQLTFFIVGFPGVLVAALMYLTVREPARKNAESHATMPAISIVIEYVWKRRGAYLSHILGISIFVMVVYALNLWGPTYFIRTFGYSTADAGFTFGIIMLLAGSAGLLIAGFIADAWSQKGTSDAYVRVILFSIVGMTPCAIALGFVNTPLTGIIAMSLAVFFSAFQGGIAGGTLQLMTPNRMRAQIMAVYLLAANLIGLGLGPTVVAATTDFIFGYDAAIGKSIALCAALLCPLGGLLLWSGMSKIKYEIDSKASA